MLSIAGRLLSLVVILALSGILGLTLLFGATASIQDEAEARAQNVVRFKDAVGDLEAALADQESGVRGYLLGRDIAFLAPFNDGRLRADSAIEVIDGLVGTVPAAAMAVADVHTAIETWETRYADPAINAVHRSQTQFTEGKSLDEGRRLFEEVRARIRSLDVIATDLIAETGRAHNSFDTTLSAVYLTTGAVILASTILVAVLLRRWVARPVRRLAAIADRVEAGEDVSFPTHGRDELARLGRSLERMRLALCEATAVSERQHVDEAARMEEQRTVNEFTELLSYLLDEREVIDVAVIALERALAPDAVIVHLLNSSGDRAGVGMAYGDLAAQDLARHDLDRCPGVRRGSPYLIEDVSRPLAVPCPAHGVTCGTVACLPLTSGTERIGAIHLIWHEGRTFHPSAWAVVDRVCMQAALTIANRRLVASLEASANTDPRTRLPNTRAFDVQAERILLSRGDQLAAILMLDLDHFKDLNDRYGHPAGDEALRTFAEMLRRSLRPGDLPARYGGEEFAVLLPGADLPAAETVAERIRAALDATPMVLAPGVVAKITVSIGVAVAPTDGSTRVALLANADRALYAAKHGGRNRVMAAASLDTAA